MIRILTIFVALVGTVSSVNAFAQSAQPLRSAKAAALFCSHSELQPNVDEAYDAARRRSAQRPVEVWLTAEQAPVIEYDRVSGSLEMSIHGAAMFTAGHAVASNVGSVGFELTEEVAQRVWARYEARTASLKLTFLPLAWSDYDKPLCRDEGEIKLLDAEVLKAEIVDEVGRAIVSFQTPLGREVALMRAHQINGYLNSGTPVVAVSSLAPFPASKVVIDDATQARVKSSLRAAVYGCYLKGLSSNARLQGALVVKISADETSILVDSLHDPAVRGCALERIADAGLRAPVPFVKATLIFRLEEAPAL